VVIYCWDYCRKKQFWSFTAGITEEGSSCGHLPLELLRKGVKVPRHQHSLHQKRAVVCTAYYFVRFYVLLTVRLVMILGK
jgi:hypothetical protein